MKGITHKDHSVDCSETVGLTATYQKRDDVGGDLGAAVAVWEDERPAHGVERVHRRCQLVWLRQRGKRSLHPL